MATRLLRRSVQLYAMLQNILVVEDDPSVERILRQGFLAEGFAVHLARNGKDGMDLARRIQPDLLVLDLGLPDISGIDVLRVLKRDPGSLHIPLLVITGGDRENQELELLQQGADDYVRKPFELRVLMARANNLLRRRAQASVAAGPVSVGALTVIPGSRTVHCGEREVDSLAPKEFDLLHVLAQEYPNAVSRQTIAQRVWGKPPEDIHPRSIDVHIRYIRLKLGRNAPVRLESVPTIGYRLRIC
ncbi:MAG TPA: response regulator transcription factor [Elusimicrobiota bacterium]|nr:response regulator transcription factor [Elusimicrobiota bacterium]